jgi:hypothetical protein
MKARFQDGIRLWLIVLFVYTATNKLMTLDRFISNLEFS